MRGRGECTEKWERTVDCRRTRGRKQDKERVYTEEWKKSVCRAKGRKKDKERV